MRLKLNFVEALVAWVVFLCCMASIGHSFVNYVVPVPAQVQRAQMDETLELFRAFDLAPRQVTR